MAEKIFDSLLETAMNAEKDFPEEINEVVTEGPDNKNLKNRPEKKDDDKLAKDDLVKEGLDEELPEQGVEEESDEDFQPQSAMDRMDGLVNQKSVEAAGLSMTDVAKDLLKDGFESEDVLEYFSKMGNEAVENAQAEMDMKRVTPGEEECVEPSI